MARKPSRHSSYENFGPSRPIESRDGIRARSQRGAFGKNWWAARWIEAMEKLLDSGRLSRGRSYARRGQVLSITETREGIEAQVQGSRPKPYHISLHVSPLSEAQWEAVTTALAGQAIFTAQLLAGEMPPDIEEAFQAAGVSLFPARGSDLVSTCSCPDWANPCKHVAAVHYILGERFDEDPFLLFRLRGRTQEQILSGLRALRAEGSQGAHPGGQSTGEDTEQEEGEASPPLEEAIGHFWEAAEGLEAFPVSIRPPLVEMPLLKRLGEPGFIPSPGLQALLGPAYHEISQAALKTAYRDADEGGVDGGEGLQNGTRTSADLRRG